MLLSIDSIRGLCSSAGGVWRGGDVCRRASKGKGKGLWSDISSLKTYHPTSHFYLRLGRSLDLFIRVPFQLLGENTVLQPFRRIVHIVHISISALPGTYFYLSQVKHLRVKFLDQGHNIEKISQN